MNAMKTALLGAVVSVAALGTAVTAKQVTISEIDVISAFGSVGNSNALQFWPSLEQDLEARLGAALLPLQAEEGAEGYTVEVNVEDVSLNGIAALSGNGEFNRLKGVVSVRGGENMHNDKFIVDLNAAASGPSVMPEGYVLIAPSSGDMYNAMLDGFARAAAERIAKMDI